MWDEVELKLEYPAKIAQDLLQGNIDVGLVPVAVLPLMKEFHIISDYCIGSKDKVASVCLFSEVAIDQIEYVYLDYQSRTSVALLKVLLRKFWKVSPQFLEASPGYETQISGNIGALVIGDRALHIRSKAALTYDLGHAWTQMTGLPFVYAAWVSNKKLPDGFIKIFNETTGSGLSQIAEIIERNNFPAYDLATYYQVNLDYLFDEPKQKALTLFLDLISSDK